MECFGCGSKDHFLKDCPNKQTTPQQRDKNQKTLSPKWTTTGQFQSKTSPTRQVDWSRTKVRSGEKYLKKRTQGSKGKGKRRPGAKGIDCEDPEGDDDSDEEDYPYEVEDSQEQEQEDGQDDDDEQNSQSQPEEGTSMVKAILTEMKNGRRE